MPIDFRGKDYFTVAERITAFREECPTSEGWGIATEIHTIDDSVVVVHATIRDPQGRIVGQGFAEEVRTKGGVNSTSALENCETSAIGRALAAAGWSGGGEYASADELQGALSAQASGNTTQRARSTPPAKKDAPKAKLCTADQAAVLDMKGKAVYGDKWPAAREKVLGGKLGLTSLRELTYDQAEGWIGTLLKHEDDAVTASLFNMGEAGNLDNLT